MTPPPPPPARRHRRRRRSRSRAEGRGARTCPAGAGRRAASGDPGSGRRARPGRPSPPRRRPAAGDAGCASRNRWGGHTETSKSCRRRPAPARSPPPRPLLSSDRKTDKKGSRPVVPCMFRVCHVWSRTGRGWRAGLEAAAGGGGGGARGGPLRRLRAPVPGRRRQVTKW